MEATVRPLAAVIDDDPADADIIALHLRTVGFEVGTQTNLLVATNDVVGVLQTVDAPPLLVVIDQRLQVDGHPDLEGWLLEFLIRVGQQQGELRPCWIAAISGDIRSRGRIARAKEAKCNFILDKLELAASAPEMYRVVMTQEPPHYVLDEDVYLRNQPAIAMLRHLSEAVAAENRVWTAADVRLLLGRFYSAIHLSERGKRGVESLLDALGGKERAQVRLKRVVAALGVAQVPFTTEIMRGESQQVIAAKHRLTWKSFQPLFDAELVSIAAQLSISRDF